MRRIYQAAISAGRLKPDVRQEQVVESLTGLQRRLIKYEPALFEWRANLQSTKPTNPDAKESEAEPPPQAPMKPRGLYIHGHVGTGKTLLMDIFFDTCEIERKRRFHLHDFMLQVHERIHHWKHVERERLALEEERKAAEQQVNELSKQDLSTEKGEQQNNAQFDDGILRSTFASPSALGSGRNAKAFRPKVAESDGITQVAKQLAQETTLLTLDEFVVTDVVDALILKHLFGVMFKEGTVVVATSNTAPGNLYKNGLNYRYFEPFIGMLTSHCKVIDMDSEMDYRLEGNNPDQDLFLTPINEENRRRFQALFSHVTQGEPVTSKQLKVSFGRTLQVPACANGACMMSFDYLCGDREPIMSAADYKSLCENFHTVFISDIPVLGMGNHNETRRFITLIDQLYDQGIRVVLLAERGPLELYDLDVALDPKDQEQGKELFSLKEMQTAAKRMRSRLVEMTSKNQ